MLQRVQEVDGKHLRRAKHAAKRWAADDGPRDAVRSTGRRTAISLNVGRQACSPLRSEYIRSKMTGFWHYRHEQESLGKANGMQPLSTKAFYAAVSTGRLIGSVTSCFDTVAWVSLDPSKISGRRKE